MSILLTSTGFSNPALADWAAREISTHGLKRAAIVVTAHRLKTERHYSQIALQQMRELGCTEAFFFDYETDDSTLLDGADALYVCGGNTFRLMAAMDKKKARPWLDQLFSRNGLYIGESAGSAVMGSTIEHLATIGMDPDEHSWGNRAALNFISQPILPHAGPEWSPIMTKPHMAIRDHEGLVWNITTQSVEQRFPPPTA